MRTKKRGIIKLVMRKKFGGLRDKKYSRAAKVGVFNNVTPTLSSQATEEWTSSSSNDLVLGNLQR